MITWVKNAIIFTAGAGIGGAVGYFVGKKREGKRADEQIRQMEKYYGKEDRYARKTECSERKNEMESEEREEKEKVRAMRKAEKVDTHKTDYTKFYKKDSEDDEDLPYDNGMSGDEIVKQDEGVESMESSDDEIGDDEELDESEEAALEADEYHEKNKQRPPRIISVDDLEDLPSSYGEEILYYYPEGDYVTDEDDNVIEDYRRILGDCIQKFHFDTSEEDDIFIQNFELDSVYEVIKAGE